MSLYPMEIDLKPVSTLGRRRRGEFAVDYLDHRGSRVMLKGRPATR